LYRVEAIWIQKCSVSGTIPLRVPGRCRRGPDACARLDPRPRRALQLESGRRVSSIHADFHLSTPTKGMRLVGCLASLVRSDLHRGAPFGNPSIPLVADAVRGDSLEPDRSSVVSLLAVSARPILSREIPKKSSLSKSCRFDVRSSEPTGWQEDDPCVVHLLDVIGRFFGRGV
jgi:hypothetical protein